MTGSFFDHNNEPIGQQRFNVSGEWWNKYADFHILPSISVDDTIEEATDVRFEWFRSYVNITIYK